MSSDQSRDTKWRYYPKAMGLQPLSPGTSEAGRRTAPGNLGSHICFLCKWLLLGYSTHSAGRPEVPQKRSESGARFVNKPACRKSVKRLRTRSGLWLALSCRSAGVNISHLWLLKVLTTFLTRWQFSLLSLSFPKWNQKICIPGIPWSWVPGMSWCPYVCQLDDSLRGLGPAIWGM